MATSEYLAQGAAPFSTIPQSTRSDFLHNSSSPLTLLMDPEFQQTRGLLAPTPEQLASVKVFPLIPSLKREVIVSGYHQPPFH